MLVPVSHINTTSQYLNELPIKPGQLIFVDDTSELYRDTEEGVRIRLGSTLELGDTDQSAFRGDLGKAAYDHITDKTAHASLFSGKADIDPVTKKVKPEQLPEIQTDQIVAQPDEPTSENTIIWVDTDEEPEDTDLSRYGAMKSDVYDPTGKAQDVFAYADAAEAAATAASVSKAGDTMTGPLTTPGISTDSIMMEGGVATKGGIASGYGFAVAARPRPTANGGHYKVTGVSQGATSCTFNSIVGVVPGVDVYFISSGDSQKLTVKSVDAETLTVTFTEAFRPNLSNGIAELLDVVIPDGTSSITMGHFSYASGIAALSQGNEARAISSYSHAQGNDTIADGIYAHAEGVYTRATGSASHSEGDSTKATGESAHSEGYETQASGGYSHAEGAMTSASGWYAHAEGESTKAEGAGSHAGGKGTTATADYSTIVGTYGETASDTLFAVANGADENNPKLALDVKADGTTSAEKLLVSGGDATWEDASFAVGYDTGAGELNALAVTKDGATRIERLCIDSDSGSSVADERSLAIGKDNYAGVSSVSIGARNLAAYGASCDVVEANGDVITLKEPAPSGYAVGDKVLLLQIGGRPAEYAISAISDDRLSITLSGGLITPNTRLCVKAGSKAAAINGTRVAIGNSSAAVGGAGSVAIGHGVINKGSTSLIVGTHGETTSNTLFAVANGENKDDPKLAMDVRSDGTTVVEKIAVSGADALSPVVSNESYPLSVGYVDNEADGGTYHAFSVTDKGKTRIERLEIGMDANNELEYDSLALGAKNRSSIGSITVGNKNLAANDRWLSITSVSTNPWRTLILGTIPAGLKAGDNVLVVGATDWQQNIIESISRESRTVVLKNPGLGSARYLLVNDSHADSNYSSAHFAIGSNNKAIGNRGPSVAIGSQLEALGGNQLIVGTNGIAETGSAFAVANGASNVPHLAFEIKSDGGIHVDEKTLVYTCNGANDNEKLTELVQAYYADESDTRPTMRLLVVGNVGVSAKRYYAESSGQDDPTRSFDFYPPSGVTKQVTLDFSGAGPVPLPTKIPTMNNSSYYACFYGGNIEHCHITANIESGGNITGFMCGKYHDCSVDGAATQIYKITGFRTNEKCSDCSVTLKATQAGLHPTVVGFQSFSSGNGKCDSCTVSLSASGDGYFSVIAFSGVGMCENCDCTITGLNGSGFSTAAKCINCYVWANEIMGSFTAFNSSTECLSCHASVNAYDKEPLHDSVVVTGFTCNVATNCHAEMYGPKARGFNGVKEAVGCDVFAQCIDYFGWSDEVGDEVLTGGAAQGFINCGATQCRSEVAASTLGSSYAFRAAPAALRALTACSATASKPANGSGQAICIYMVGKGPFSAIQCVCEDGGNADESILIVNADGTATYSMSGNKLFKPATLNGATCFDVIETPVNATDAANKAYVDAALSGKAERRTATATLSTENWTGSANNWSQSVPVSWMLDTDMPTVRLITSGEEQQAAYDSLENYADSATGSLKFYCKQSTPPSVAIDVYIEVIR